ncbi:MAG: YHYH protein [Isosphaeraceae bacterium]|nr:YHYH protein [Isosphaeraceae bacterium]
MRISRRTCLVAAIGLPAAGAAATLALRKRAQRGPTVIHEYLIDHSRVVESNGLPGHATGDFPNAHDPVGIRSQHYHFEMPRRPSPAKNPVPLGFWLFGVAINGVPFDPSGPFWNRDARSGWQFEVLCPTNAVALGIDVNRAHVQGRGRYHYHGLPTGLLWDVKRRDPARTMALLGHAADGHPIYGPEAPSRADDPNSPLTRLRSSFRVRSGRRPGGPGGRHDGTFVEDHEYVPGLGDLDECNGRRGPTPEYPDGTYYYVLTDDFPYVPRSFRGAPDPTFRHGPPPGVSPPLPSELRNYRGVG